MPGNHSSYDEVRSRTFTPLAVDNSLVDQLGRFRCVDLDSGIVCLPVSREDYDCLGLDLLCDLSTELLEFEVGRVLGVEHDGRTAMTEEVYREPARHVAGQTMYRSAGRSVESCLSSSCKSREGRCERWREC